jgi:c-di-GMP-binding flagellar brake protein YcgR
MKCQIEDGESSNMYCIVDFMKLETKKEILARSGKDVGACFYDNNRVSTVFTSVDIITDKEDEYSFLMMVSTD